LSTSIRPSLFVRLVAILVLIQELRSSTILRTRTSTCPLQLAEFMTYLVYRSSNLGATLFHHPSDENFNMSTPTRRVYGFFGVL
jgi:hypothetical protein